jgi:hypothetical protein
MAGGQQMNRLVIALAATLMLGTAAQAQGLVGGVRQGAAEGDRQAGPVGAIVGGAVGGAVGTVNGALGLDHHARTHRHLRRAVHHTRRMHRTVHHAARS